MSMTAIAHGLDGRLVEPDWPSLTLAEVRALLAAFPGRGEPIEILSVSPRPFFCGKCGGNGQRTSFYQAPSPGGARPRGIA